MVAFSSPNSSLEWAQGSNEAPSIKPISAEEIVSFNTKRSARTEKRVLLARSPKKRASKQQDRGLRKD